MNKYLECFWEQVGINCRMFDIILDNNLNCCWIIFKMFVDYVADVLILSLDIMLSSAGYYNLLLQLIYFYYLRHY